MRVPSRKQKEHKNTYLTKEFSIMRERDGHPSRKLKGLLID
jgi:hypothetical protein